MVRCAGCGGRTKLKRSVREEIEGQLRLFCCGGCIKLYGLDYGGVAVRRTQLPFVASYVKKISMGC